MAEGEADWTRKQITVLKVQVQIADHLLALIAVNQLTINLLLSLVLSAPLTSACYLNNSCINVIFLGIVTVMCMTNFLQIKQDIKRRGTCVHHDIHQCKRKIVGGLSSQTFPSL